MSPSPPMPIDECQSALLDALASVGRVVVTAPTGSGKSTRVPLWCAELGRVLVVEPRRVACRSLAGFVARSEGTRLGHQIGYAVRHDHRYDEQTRVVYATPGTALRFAQGDRRTDALFGSFDTLILDEFHERHIDVDLLLGMAMASGQRLVVMSATLQAERLTRHLDAALVQSEGRVFPVGVEHDDRPQLPSPRDLAERVSAAVVRSLERATGNILVFLPGKGAIADCQKALATVRAEVLPLHGGLPTDDVDRVFAGTEQRRVVLATNVAETSLTLPDVGTVIDSGLVKQTRYQDGIGALTLVPISRASAEQRRGRAGRTRAGHCVRLYSQAAPLDDVDRPEILREDLTDTALMAASCGWALTELELLDRPPRHVLTFANERLTRLGCLDAEGGITTIGREVARLPVSATLARALVEARASGQESLMQDMVDLVAGLAAGRRVVRQTYNPSDERHTWSEPACDAVLLVAAVRAGKADRDGLARYPLRDARAIAKQLRSTLDVPGLGRDSRPMITDRLALARAWLRADPDSGFARRRRGSALANAAGLEVRPAKGGLLHPEAEAAVVLAIRASRYKGRLEREATYAMPIPLSLLGDAEVAEQGVASVRVDKGVLVCQMERRVSGRLLDSSDEIPTGPAAVEALATALTTGLVFAKAVEETRYRAQRIALYRRVKRLSFDMIDADTWLRERAREVGLTDGRELALLSPDDFRLPWPDVMTAAERVWLDKQFPATLDLGDTTYDIEYETARRVVTLVQRTKRKRPLPNPMYLPTWSGFSVHVRRGTATSVVRQS